MDNVQFAFEKYAEEPLDDMTVEKLLDLQWLIMQALKRKVIPVEDNLSGL